MGADGGLQFMRLKKPNATSRLKYLLKYFPVTYEHNIQKTNKISRSSYDDWFENNKNYTSSTHLVGVYGTDLFNEFSLDDLKEIITSLVQEKETLQKEIGINKNSTFEDLFQEKETRSDLWWFYSYITVDLIIKIINKSLPENSFKTDKDFMNMKIYDWVDEVMSIVDISKCETYETWT